MCQICFSCIYEYEMYDRSCILPCLTHLKFVFSHEWPNVFCYERSGLSTNHPTISHAKRWSEKGAQLFTSKSIHILFKCKILKEKAQKQRNLNANNHGANTRLSWIVIEMVRDHITAHHSTSQHTAAAAYKGTYRCCYVYEVEFKGQVKLPANNLLRKQKKKKATIHK